MARNVVLAVLGKISNLLIQESDSLLGVDDQIQWIETKLRQNADWVSNVPNQTKLREIIYDVEDVIDQLIIRAAKRRTRNASLQIVLAFGDDIPKHFFHVFAILDLIDYCKLRNKLELLKVEISSIFSCFFLSGTWQKSFALYDLSTGNTVISPVIAKLATMATQEQLSPEVRKQARYLRDEFKSLKDFLKVVESKELSKDGMRWMEELFNLCHSTENVVGLFMDTSKRQMRKGKGFFKNLFWIQHKVVSQHELAKKMARIKEKICKISDGRYKAIPRRDPATSFERSPQQRRALPFAADQLDTSCFQEDVDAVMAQLLKDNPRCLTISIVGVAGIGKTSLASLIYHSKTIADHFPHRAWVSGNEIEIIQQILNVDDDSELYRGWYETEESYENCLRQKVNSFFADKKYLIVVDDSYASEFWRQMGGAFRDISNGTRIIFTVRHLRHAPPVTDTNFIYRLHLRSNDESFTLFLHTLKKSIPPLLKENVKKDILRNFGGIPNVIVNLGEVLSQRDISEWSRVIELLNQDEQHWSQVLEEINKYLPLHLRRCLFYFGLFPRGYRIPARRLIALWVSEGLGRQQNDENPPECVAESCLMELINYNMVQVTEKKINGKIKTCCLPEALRLHWFTKAKEANFLEGHNQKTSMMRRLADHVNPNDAIFDHIHSNRSSTCPYSCYKDVVSFLSFDTRHESRAGEDVDNFLARCISSNSLLFLWVLDLENVYKPRLPKAVGQLTLLRYLGLRSTYLGILPVFIDKLLNLQTLDLKRTHINALPSTIWKMQKLRHLFIDESFHSMFAPRQDDGYLPELQTLWGVFVDEESPVRNGLDTLLSVTKLGLTCKISAPSQQVAMSSQLDAVANWVQYLKHLQSLRLKSFDESNQPWDLHLESLSSHMDLTSIYLVGRLKNQYLISELPQNLIEITLSASGLAEDPMQTLDKLCNLRILIFLQRSFIGKKMLCSSGGFPKLEVVKFKKLKLLEEWNVEEGALPSLKDLEIESCDGLKMLPDGLQLIKTLRKLKLVKVPVLSSRIKNIESEDWNKIAHIGNVCMQD